jgi:hypothetical protein
MRVRRAVAAEAQGELKVLVSEAMRLHLREVPKCGARSWNRMQWSCRFGLHVL